MGQEGPYVLVAGVCVDVLENGGNLKTHICECVDQVWHGTCSQTYKVGKERNLMIPKPWPHSSPNLRITRDSRMNR